MCACNLHNEIDMYVCKPRVKHPHLLLHIVLDDILHCTIPKLKEAIFGESQVTSFKTQTHN